MKRALLVWALIILTGLLSGCTKDEKDKIDGGIDASVDEETDAGGDTDDNTTVHKKCSEVGPLHHCVGLDDCPWYNLRTQFTCPPLFVCCVDWSPPAADSGVDSGG